MSDERRDPEDVAVEGALALLERGAEAQPVEPTDEATATLVRLHAEAVGLIPYALEPVLPRADLKDRVLHAIIGDETIEVPGQAQLWPKGPASGERARPAIPPSLGSLEPVRRSRWPLALAAVLTLAFLGTSAWLALQVSDQGSEVARLRSELQQARQSAAEMAKAKQALGSAQANLALASSPAVLVCPLRPMAKADAPAPQPGAFGMLFVAADHQHWYLSVRGLGKCPEGRVYQLWFHGPNGVLASGGTFDVTPGGPSELSSQTMPAGTRAASVTLEPRTGTASPTGPQVLYGEEMTQIL